MEPQNDLVELLSVKNRQNGIPAELERQVRFAAWSARGLVIASIAVALFVARTEWTFREREVRLSKLEAWKDEHTRAVILQDKLVENLDRDFRNAVREWEPRARTLDEMAGMLKRGQSNKESFFLEHGYEAPSMIPNSYGKKQEP